MPAERPPFLDIIDKKINALVHNAKGLVGIQRDGTGRNGTELALTGSNGTELAPNGTKLPPEWDETGSQQGGRRSRLRRG